jgi:tRNA-splicing ligase RtcB (3'-phosphate/5'-hydroxy nucleic acid ligase)
MGKKQKHQPLDSSALRDEPLPYRVWGEEFIQESARAQMDNAMRLPVAVAGALMPDAHVGYGLPIGGVLATEDCVLPYAVGVDIACRMRLTLFRESPIVIDQKSGQFKKALTEQTLFGAGVKWQKGHQNEHEVLDDLDWNATGLLKSLKDTAYQQLGSSGTGNHFVEWGEFTLTQDDETLGLKERMYLALLSHSGSRGVGFKIANYYSELAMQLHPDLDKSVRQLAWLPLNSEAGQAYWTAMELAGRFAKANHEVIHQRLAKAIGLKPVASVENHHNFSWRETVHNGYGGSQDVIVHRKGATPAGKGVLGIIPGSMADPGYLVRGRGEAASLNSAAHGAGRAMGRKQAIQSITKTERDKLLKERGVTLIGGGLDEAPQAYKHINDIIGAQTDLVDILGRFKPKIVRMATEKGDW